MIRVEVDPWCQEGCEAFDPDVQMPTAVMNLDNDPFFKTDTIIRCNHRGMCRGIKRYLEKLNIEKEVSHGSGR